MDKSVRASTINDCTAITRDGLQEAFSMVEKRADRIAHSAGMQGCRHDGGAQQMRRELEFYKLGREGDFPAEWDMHVERLRSDEYQEYLRLKKKFR